MINKIAIAITTTIFNRHNKLQFRIRRSQNVNIEMIIHVIIIIIIISIYIRKLHQLEACKALKE